MYNFNMAFKIYSGKLVSIYLKRYCLQQFHLIYQRFSIFTNFSFLAHSLFFSYNKQTHSSFKINERLKGDKEDNVSGSAKFGETEKGADFGKNVQQSGAWTDPLSLL